MKEINIKNLKWRFKSELVYGFMNENNISKSKFCKMCKISYSTFLKILESKSNFRISALFKIARVLNLQVYQIVE